jgi:predicted nuclease of predicted toxin-antitoxin system
MKFFMDQCVPDSVGRFLEAAGHEVVFLRREMPPDSPDPLVAAISEMMGAVLVTHDSDFKALAPRVPGAGGRFKKLSRIQLGKCQGPMAASRMEVALSLIEHEWSVAQVSDDKRMIVDIGLTSIRTLR